MKVLFTAWRELAHPDAGGSEVYVHRVAQGLHDRGHEVTLLAGGPVGAQDYAVIDAGGQFGQYLKVPARHRRRFRDADLVVDVANGMVAFSPLWHASPTLCVVHHVHTDQWAQRFGPVLTAVGRNLESRAMPRVYRRGRFVAVSPSTAEGLVGLGVPADRIDVVPNGVDALPSAGPTSTEPRFAVVGRLVPHKRVDLALEAWERVRPRVGGRLLVVGRGPEEARLRALGVEGVDWVDWVPEEDKADLLASAWILVHPAMHEGWGLVIMEAAAAGTPTLAFDVDGVRDSVADGESGVLVGSTDELVEQWVALAGDAGRRRALGEAARTRAATFSWEHTVDHFEAVARRATGAS